MVIPADYFLQKNKAGLLKPTLQMATAGYNFLQLLFCNNLSNPAIVLVKSTVFILSSSRSVYCLLNRVYLSSFLTDLTQVKVS